MKRRRNHILAYVPTDELIEEIIHRNTFLGLVIVSKLDHHPLLNPPATHDRTAVEFVTQTLLTETEQIKLLDVTSTELKKK